MKIKHKKLVVLTIAGVLLMFTLAFSLFIAPAGWAPGGGPNVAAPGSSADLYNPATKPSNTADVNDPNYGFRPAIASLPNGCGASPDNCRTTADVIWPDAKPSNVADLYAPNPKPSIVASLTFGIGGPAPDPTAVEYGS